MRCPIPGCREVFRNLRSLTSHLKSVVRRNRCGAFVGTFDFECICGETLHTKELILAHHSLHSFKSITRADAEGTAVVLPVEVFAENVDSETEASVGTHTDTNTIAGRLCESVDAERSSDVAINFAHVDESGSEFDVMFNEIDLVGDDEAEEEGSDSDAGANEVINLKYLTGATVDLTVLEEFDESMTNLFDLYRFCIERNVTVKGYRQLRSLAMFKTFDGIPRNLKDLRRKVERHVEESCHWPCKRIAVIAGKATPYMSMDDCLAVWLAVPSIIGAVREWGQKYLPRNLIDGAAYDDLVSDRLVRIEAGSYSYNTVADGSFYLENIRGAIPLFEGEYLRAIDEGVEVLVCTVGLYEDNFSKNLNSLISQTLFCTTLIEATTGEADLTGMSTLVSMIADASLTKSNGGDEHRKVLCDSLLRYQNGKRMVVSGQEVLIICLTMSLMGDTPALKTMIGKSPSISSTCYVKMPCMLCEVLVEDLSRLGADRSLATVNEFFRSNANQTGAPSTAWLRESMKKKGFLRIPEIIRLHNQPNPSSVSLDTMHILFRGVLVKHFTKLAKILGLGEREWRLVSKEFATYCRQNRISAFCKFTNKKEFKVRMTAGSMREFTRASPTILRKLGFVPRNDVTVAQKKRLEFFNYWCVHVRVADILERHSISSAELRDLDVLISQLLEHWKSDFPLKFWTINVHYYHHFVEKIRLQGSLRVVANNSREHIIQKLKPFYRNNNNNEHKEVSIYRRYILSLFYCMNDLMVHGDRLIYGREFIPEGHATFDFYLWDKVEISNSLSSRRYSREDYSTLGVFSHDNRDSVRFKVNYCMLRRGDIVVVCCGPEYTVDVGVLVTILSCKEEVFLAYKRPQRKICGVDPLLLLSPLQASKEYEERTLVLVPITSFVKRGYIYAFSKHWNEILY